MERESKYGFAAFSWADEVEKEEEEEAQAQPHQIQKQKANPFGSARPREVVLQERGIDWRKLDQDLIHLSNIRNKAQSEKSCKENIPAPAAHVFDIIQSDPPSRSPEQKPADTRFSSKRREVPWVPLAHQNQIPLIVSPPLRYPPKNLIPRLLESSSICCNPCGFDNWQQQFQCKNRLGTEKEKARNKQRFQKAHSLDPRSHVHPQLDQNTIWSNSQSSEFKNNGTETQHLVLQIEAQHSGKNLRKSAACMNQQEMRMFNAQNLVGTPLVNGRRAPVLRQDRWKHLQDDYVRSDSGFSHRRDNNSRTERSFAEELEWEIRGFDNESPKVARNVTVTVRNCKRAVSGQNLKVKRAC
ncbi:uncharacterized protein LOC126726085 [Quercus robur]|uniref:uncharacterized protein LOC126726085 n=1 Tax=Quercus robur TaxID=38942 RepID=UPI002162588D|nr:uncharacterized protein LOC126726085 [Quercus robur]